MHNVRLVAGFIIIILLLSQVWGSGIIVGRQH